MKTTLIKNAKMVNENQILDRDIRIQGQRISQINPELTATDKDLVIDAKGQYLLPGMIDDPGSLAGRISSP